MNAKFLTPAIASLALCLAGVKTTQGREVDLSIGKQVAISYIGGFGGTMMGGMMGSLTYWLAATKEQKERDKAYHETFYISSGVTYFLVGAIIGYPVGSAILLHLNDRSSSFPWMVAGALGTELAVTGIVALAGNYDDPTLFKASLWVYLLVPLATVVAFNQTREKIPRYSDTLIEIQDGKLRLCLPRVAIGTRSNQNLGFNLIRVKF